MYELYKSVTSPACGLGRFTGNQTAKRKGWTNITSKLKFRNGINPEMHPVVTRAVRMEAPGKQGADRTTARSAGCQNPEVVATWGPTHVSVVM